MRLMNNIKKEKGFTLIELLVVIVILAILSTIGLTSFRSSLIKSRDAKRKSDLEQVQRALEMYYNDNNKYPTATGGKINNIAWGDLFDDVNDTIYMKALPKDPTGKSEYCYRTSGTPPNSYQLYATLENTEDPKATLDITCNIVPGYNYGVSSSNATP